MTTIHLYTVIQKPGTMAKTFKHIFKDVGTQPAFICMDLGTDLIAGAIKDMLQNRNICLIHILYMDLMKAV